MRVLINCLLSLFLLALLLAVSPPAEAKRGLGKILLAPFGKALPRTRLKGGGSQPHLRHTGQILTKAQLRTCVAQHNRINAKSEQLKSEKAVLPSFDDANKKKIQALADDIDKLEIRIQTERPSVNVYDQESVDNFNLLVRRQKSMIDRHNTMAVRHRALVKQHKAKVSEFNRRQESHNSQIDDFNQRCAHSYYKEDMDEILAETSKGNSSE